MSDVEIVDVVIAHSKKKKKQHVDRSRKSRRRTSSGLIEKSDIMKGTETDFEDFVVDRTITPQRKLKVKDVDSIENQYESASPWRQKLESTLLGLHVQPEPKKKQSSNILYHKSCFNCDGEHNLRDCPRPKDFRRIQNKKRECGDETRRKQQPYDIAGLSKQKQKSMKPGELSEKLRTALGLQLNDIPEHIYRMRRLGFIKGYPPGWLRKAIKSTDVLKIYSSEPNSFTEDNVLMPPVLDMSKIVCYPGFNGESAELFDRETFKIPPMNEFCSWYQEELRLMFEKQKKASNKKSKLISKHKKFEDDDNDVVILEIKDSRETSQKFNTPGEEHVVSVLNEFSNKDERNESPMKINVEMGQSMFELIGTPILKEIVTPNIPLEAFAVGIQPFRADAEDIESKGNFKKLMDKLKEARAEASDTPLQSCTQVQMKKTKRSRKRNRKNITK